MTRPALDQYPVYDECYCGTPSAMHGPCGYCRAEAESKCATCGCDLTKQGECPACTAIDAPEVCA